MSKTNRIPFELSYSYNYILQDVIDIIRRKCKLALSGSHWIVKFPRHFHVCVLSMSHVLSTSLCLHALWHAGLRGEAAFFDQLLISWIPQVSDFTWVIWTNLLIPATTKFMISRNYRTDLVRCWGNNRKQSMFVQGWWFAKWTNMTQTLLVFWLGDQETRWLCLSRSPSLNQTSFHRFTSNACKADCLPFLALICNKIFYMNSLPKSNKLLSFAFWYIKCSVMEFDNCWTDPTGSLPWPCRGLGLGFSTGFGQRAERHSFIRRWTNCLALATTAFFIIVS